MDTAEPVLEGMFNNIEEQELLFSCLTPGSIVLEYGSGKSTLAIAKRCKMLFSIEHNAAYYSFTNLLLESAAITNVALTHVPRNSEELPGHDGTYDNYEDYINHGMLVYHTLLKNKEDISVIFIDGRARVECAKLALHILKPGGIILIHDYKNPVPEYRRHEYEEVESFLTLVDQAYAMAKFTVK